MSDMLVGSLVRIAEVHRCDQYGDIESFNLFTDPSVFGIHAVTCGRFDANDVGILVSKSENASQIQVLTSGGMGWISQRDSSGHIHLIC